MAASVYLFVSAFMCVSFCFAPRHSLSQKMADKLEEELKQPTSHEEAFVTIPKASRSSEEVVEMLERYSSEERKLWRGAKISGAIYHG